MPAIAIGVGVAAGSAGGAAIAAHKQSNAAVKGAQIQSNAATEGARLQSASADKALSFQQSQAAEDARRFETTQRANYDQWAAQQGYRSSIGQMLGLPARNTPGYVSSMPGGSPQGMAGGDPKLTAAIAAYQQANPGKVAIEPLTAALKQQGFNVDRFKYDGGVLSNNELNVGGQKYKVLGGEGTASAYWYIPGTNDAAPGATNAPRGYVSPMSTLFQPWMMPQTVQQPLTPALKMPGLG